MALEYVDVAAARGARGTRLVTSALVPSPWSEAAKGLFELAGLPALVIARGRDATEINAWTGVDNVPVLLHDDEPARTCWAAIVGLVARLAPGLVVPHDPVARADVLGWLDLVAGEGGLGWNARLAITARERLADLVPAELWTHRTRMFERHLRLPIRLA